MSARAQRFLRAMPRVEENPHSVAFFASAKGSRHLANALRKHGEMDHHQAAVRRAERDEARRMYAGIESIRL